MRVAYLIDMWVYVGKSSYHCVNILDAYIDISDGLNLDELKNYKDYFGVRNLDYKFKDKVNLGPNFISIFKEFDLVVVSSTLSYANLSLILNNNKLKYDDNLKANFPLLSISLSTINRSIINNRNILLNLESISYYLPIPSLEPTTSIPKLDKSSYVFLSIN